MNTRRCALASSLLVCLLLTGRSVAAQTPSGLTVESKQNMPLKILWGYGSLATHFVLYHNRAGKHALPMTLYASTSDTAALTLGKYNSDLRELGEVTDSVLIIGKHTIPIAIAAGQGAMTAFRQGATVTIAAAEGRQDLPRLLVLTPMAARGSLDFTGSSVPMYLNLFDKYPKVGRSSSPGGHEFFCGAGCV